MQLQSIQRGKSKISLLSLHPVLLGMNNMNEINFLTKIYNRKCLLHLKRLVTPTQFFNDIIRGLFMSFQSRKLSISGCGLKPEAVKRRFKTFKWMNVVWTKKCFWLSKNQEKSCGIRNMEQSITVLRKNIFPNVKL